MLREYTIKQLVKAIKKYEGKEIVIGELMTTLYNKLTRKQLIQMESHRDEIFENFESYGFSDYLDINLYYCNPIAFYLGILTIESMHILHDNDYLYENWRNKIVLTDDIINDIINDI